MAAAVVLPGEHVTPGDIIHFKFGYSRWLRKPNPWGSFDLIVRLEDLGVEFQTRQSPDPNPYIFASKGSVSMNLNMGASGGVTSGPQAEGKLDIAFSEVGSVYFSAVECSKVEMTNLSQVQVALEQHKRDIIWRDTFLVSSVTTAKKALIMQSSTSSGKLAVTGAVKGLQAGAAGSLNASVGIAVESASDASFLKDWSDNVTVFFGLHKFEKIKFGRTEWIRTAEDASTVTDLVNTDNDQFRLIALSPQEFLVD